MSFATASPDDAPTHKPILDVLDHRARATPPIWLMRQAALSAGTNGAPSYPASLRISESAKERIRSLVKEVETCNPGVSFFAEVYWATAVRGRQTSSGPAIGVWEAGEVSDRDMQVVDGLKLVANLDTSSWRHFENKTLDYVGGRLMLVEPE